MDLVLKPIIFASDKYGIIINIKKQGFKYWFKNNYLPKYLNFVRLCICDIVNKKRDRLFGIYMFCGLFGQGKTLSMVNYVLWLKERNPDIHIYSNISLSFGEGNIKSWKDILSLPPRSVVLIDEIQATFSTDSWRDFPPELLTKITQCRKKELMILCTAQIYDRVVKQIRELVQYVVQCSNVLNSDRLFTNKFFYAHRYETWYNSLGTDREKKIQPYFRISFVADDDLYNTYDTLEEVQSLKNNVRKIS